MIKTECAAEPHESHIYFFVWSAMHICQGIGKAASGQGSGPEAYS